MGRELHGENYKGDLQGERYRVNYEGRGATGEKPKRGGGIAWGNYKGEIRWGV